MHTSHVARGSEETDVQSVPAVSCSFVAAGEQAYQEGLGNKLLGEGAVSAEPWEGTGVGVSQSSSSGAQEIGTEHLCDERGGR